MSLYRFHTFRTDYYFPDWTKDNEFLFGLYHPYNRYPVRLLAVKLYWWLFRHCDLVRKKHIVINPDEHFPYSEITDLCPENSLMSFNMGTPGIERKISMLGLEPNGNRFFAKYSTLPAAMALSRNEIMWLDALKDTGLAPLLFDYKDETDFVFFRTECVSGINPKDVSMNEQILNLSIRISMQTRSGDQLKKSLSHGDFTPWNVIITPAGEYKMIDWEMAAERELGYDILTYITHVGMLLSPNQQLTQLISENKTYIDRYFAVFDVTDWTPYLNAFAKRRIRYETEKNEIERAAKYKCLL